MLERRKECPIIFEIQNEPEKMHAALLKATCFPIPLVASPLNTLVFISSGCLENPVVYKLCEFQRSQHQGPQTITNPLLKEQPPERL